jgi:hypothetical protein
MMLPPRALEVLGSRCIDLGCASSASCLEFDPTIFRVPNLHLLLGASILTIYRLINQSGADFHHTLFRWVSSLWIGGDLLPAGEPTEERGCTTTRASELVATETDQRLPQGVLVGRGMYRYPGSRGLKNLPEDRESASCVLAVCCTP